MKISTPQTVYRPCIIAGLLIASVNYCKAETIDPQCRGLAAGIVATMKSAGEVTTEQVSRIAVLAARRACAATLEGLITQPAGSKKAATTRNENSVWDILPSNQNIKEGNDRLRRLRTQ